MSVLPPQLLSADDIERRVGELAAEIDGDLAPDGTGDVDDDLVLVGVLKGSFIFLADLARRLTIPRSVEFIAVSSYGNRRSEEATGSVRLLMDVRHDLAGRRVLIVEDIVDTGHTLAYLARLLRARQPALLRTCTLLYKPDRIVAEVPLDYVGFTIPDVWVVGYGLDYAERFRTLPYVASLPPELR